jgi:hypothetical protein
VEQSLDQMIKRQSGSVFDLIGMLSQSLAPQTPPNAPPQQPEITQ